jgi:predicted nucleic acid-binding protein
VIVVDANVIAYLYLPGVFTPRAETLLERDAEWAVPWLWRSEFRNILAGYVQRNTISFESAVDLQAEAERLLAGGEYDVESRAVLELASRSGCSAYDCEFVALAVTLGVRLVTMDAQVLRAFPALTVSLRAL